MMNLETYLSDKPKKINRSHKEYPEKFYQDIMDDSYRPINKIWVDEWLHKAGIYVGILNGHRKISSYKEWYKNMIRVKRDDFYF